MLAPPGKVAAVDKPRWIVWAKPASTWAWTLSAAPGGRTRLVTRLRVRFRWERPAAALFSLVLIELDDFAMMRRMLFGIEERAEGAAPTGDSL